MKHHLYLQIASKLRTKILRGDYAPEQQIPSIRRLAENEKCNPATVQKAMKFSKNRIWLLAVEH